MNIDITELNVIDLKPGQVLVATTTVKHIVHFEHIQDTLNKMFPDNTIIVKTDELTFEVIDGEA